MNNETKQKKPFSIISLDSQQSQDEQTLKERDASNEIMDTPQTQGQSTSIEQEKLNHVEQKNSSKTELQLRSINMQSALAKKQGLSQNIIQIEEEEEQSVCTSPKNSIPFNLPSSLDPKIISIHSGTENPQNTANDLEKQKDNGNKTAKRVHFGNTEIIKNLQSDTNTGVVESKNEQEIRNAKYFFQKEGNESQYEREQLTIQTETEKSHVINAVKFSSLQNKIEEIKGKRYQQGLQKKQEEKHKQLYKVDKSFLKTQSHLQASKVLKNHGGKRKNPFSCESDSGEHVEDAADEEQDDQHNGFGIQDLTEEEQIVCKSMSHISSKFISELASFRQDLKRSENLTGQPNTKWGPCFLFQQNSFNQEKQTTLVDSCITASQHCKKEEQQIFSQDQVLLYRIPEYVMGNILQFLEKNELFELRKVSKFFNNSVFFSIHRLEFVKSDSPKDRVIDLLSKAKYLQSIKFGRLSQVTSIDLLDHWIRNVQTSLLTFECSDYTQLTEKLFVEVLKTSPNITTLALPFFGGITENSLFLLPTLAKKLTHLKLESSIESYKINDKISDATMARVVSDNNNLISFQVFTISPIFFEKLREIESQKQQNFHFQNEILMNQNESSIASSLRQHYDAFARIQILKIRNLILTRNLEENLDSSEQQLNHLKDFTQLKELKIVNILRKAKGEWFLPHTPQLSIIFNIFSSVKDLSSLCVGEWCTNEVLGRISENLFSLKSIRIIGSSVNDAGLEMIFQKMEKLEKVNIVDATRINGHCFESVISRSLSQIKVQFNDYRMNCLKCTIVKDLQLPNIIILNLKK